MALKRYRRRGLVSMGAVLVTITLVVIIAEFHPGRKAEGRWRAAQDNGAVDQPPSPPTTMELKDPALASLLTNATGMTRFWFDLSLFTQRRGEICFWKSASRSLQLESARTAVVFTTVLADGREERRVQPLRDTDRPWHFVAAQWTTNEAMLFVDGEGTWPRE